MLAKDGIELASNTGLAPHCILPVTLSSSLGCRACMQCTEQARREQGDYCMELMTRELRDGNASHPCMLIIDRLSQSNKMQTKCEQDATHCWIMHVIRALHWREARPPEGACACERSSIRIITAVACITSFLRAHIAITTDELRTLILPSTDCLYIWPALILRQEHAVRGPARL
jgi:hypothetical protein